MTKYSEIHANIDQAKARRIAKEIRERTEWVMDRAPFAWEDFIATSLQQKSIEAAIESAQDWYQYSLPRHWVQNAVKLAKQMSNAPEPNENK